jgi:hypothetical protein
VTKVFPLRTILTVTTGRLLTQPKGEDDNGIGDLYEILGWMTNDSPYTHQLGRFAEESKPWLFRWFPELGTASACLDKLDGWLSKMRDKSSEGAEQALAFWFTEIKMLEPRLKDEYEVPKIPADDHEQKEPYAELVSVRGTDEGIVVVSD